MKKYRLFRGLSGVMALLMIVSVVATSLVLDNASMINTTFGIDTSVTIGNPDSYTVYVANDYGYDASALTEVYRDAADAMVEIESEGVVLLKNENSALPIASGSTMTIFGNAAVNSAIFTDKAPDGMSSVNFVTAMQTEFGESNVNTVLCTDVYAGMGSTGTNSVQEASVSDIKAHESTWQSNYNDVAVVVLARKGSEGNDVYQYASDDTYSDGSARRMLDLSTNEEAMMNYLSEQKKAGVFKSIVVVVSSDYMMEFGFLDEYDVDACVLVGQGGTYGCTGMAQVLSGAVNPSGKTVDTYASNSFSSPANTYAGVSNTQKWTNADELNEYDKINNDDNIDYYVIYAEGVYVGYKYYETRYEDVVMGTGNANGTAGTFNSTSSWSYVEEMCFPFGYGLSYTTFEQTLDSVEFNESDNTYTVKVTVTNTGDVAGKDVVEVYAQTPYGDYEKENKVEKASVNLVAYDKTDLLEPGASQTLEIPVREYFLASYDTYGAQTYILSAGDYYLTIGNGAHEAINNILAAKGYTTANGMTDDGDAAKTYTWNQAEMDSEKYSTSTQTGYEVTNAFDDADINYYDGYDFTYLTRNDWEGTYPKEAVQLSATQQMMDALSNYDYETPADAPSVDSFTQGADNGLTLVDMIGVDFDDEKWDTFIDELTVEEMAKLTYTAKAKQATPELDIPGAQRRDDETTATSSDFKFVSHPVVSRTWNTDMNTTFGKFEGLVCTLNGREGIWYGAANLHRTPFGGRNYQYWSEDPVVSYYNGYYECAAGIAVGCDICVKHMCCNDQETERCGLSVFVDEQALRENYLRAFEGSFDGGCLCVMTTTGRVGTRLGKNYYSLLTTVLRNEWGYQGHVTSDAYVPTGYYNNLLECITAGMDFSCGDNSGATEKAVLDAINGGDGYILQCLRLAAKRNLYVMSNLAIMNGLGSGAKVLSYAPAWEIALVVANLVLFVLLVAFVICMIVARYKATVRKKETPQPKLEGGAQA